MKKVVISEKISEAGMSRLEKAGFKVVISPSIDAEGLKSVITDAYGLIMRSTKLPNEVIEAGKNLKIISRNGTGVDNVDVDFATQKNVLVAKVDGANAYSVAEYVITTILTLSRRIMKSDSFFKNGTLSRPGESLPGLADKFDLNGHEIRNKILGIVGLGKIGTIVAELATALGMKVIAYDPYVKKSRITLVETVDDILKESDFISLNLPYTEETKNFIGEKELTAMKDTAFLINSSRGGIVDERALATALNEQNIAGAALDVFRPEPPAKDSPLLTAKNIILTAHIGGTTAEASAAIGIGAAQAIIDFSNGKMPEFPVNPQVFDKIK